jgi:hypothetical protein
MADAELSRKRAEAGRKGGKKSRKGGFAANPSKAKIAGKISRLKHWHPEMTDEEINKRLAQELTDYADAD